MNFSPNLKIIVIFICMIFLNACARLNFKNEAIVFSNSLEGFDIGSQLILKENNVFFYEVQVSGLIYKAEGNWEKEGNKITLSSNDKGRGKVVVAKEFVSVQNNLKIKVLDLEDNPHVGVSILINDAQLDEVGITDINGCTFLKKKEVQLIRINYLGSDYYYKVENEQANFFELKIKLQDPGIIHFDKQEWILRGEKISPPKGLKLKKH